MERNSRFSFNSTRSIYSASRSRTTSFSDNKLIPDLNIFSPGPGSGKYSRPNSSRKYITLLPSPAYSFAKAKRNTLLSFTPITPDHFYTRPKSGLGPAYAMGLKLNSENYKYKTITPSPCDYAPERSKDFLKSNIQYGSIGKEERFSTKFLTIF